MVSSLVDIQMNTGGPTKLALKSKDIFQNGNSFHRNLALVDNSILRKNTKSRKTLEVVDSGLKNGSCFLKSSSEIDRKINIPNKESQKKLAIGMEFLSTAAFSLKDDIEFPQNSTLDGSTNSKKGTGQMIPSRYIIAILGFFSCIIITCQRLNLSMALVAMVNRTSVFHRNLTDFYECASSYHVAGTGAEIHSGTSGHLMWDSETQGHILGASFFGFVLANIPGGRLSETVGAKQILVFSLVCASMSNILSPLASTWGAYALLGVQFTKGFSHGLIQPAISCWMAQWFPKPEKGFLSSLTFSGYPAGAVAGGMLSGTLCDSSVFGGWPSVFYVFGFMGLVLSVFIYHFSSNSPEDHDSIPNEELKYIVSNRETTCSETELITPWKPIMSSKATWAVFIGMFGQYWMTFYFLSVHPTYLGQVLHFTNTENGYLNSLPYIGQTFIIWSASYVSDWFVNNQHASTNTMRKICNSLSCVGYSLCLVGVAFARCDQMLNVILFIFAISSVGFGFPGSVIVPIDMSVAFAGTLMGISCTVASTSGFLIPLLVGYLTNGQQTLDQWNKVLYISAGVGLGSGITFNLFGSASLQDWDTSNSNRDPDKGVANEAFEPTSDFHISIYCPEAFKTTMDKGKQSLVALHELGS